MPVPVNIGVPQTNQTLKDSSDGDVYESQAQFISGNLEQASEFIREAWRVINNLYAHLAIFLGALFLSFYTINSDWLRKLSENDAVDCPNRVAAICEFTLFKNHTRIDEISCVICVAGMLGCFFTAIMLDQMARHARRFLSWAAIIEAFAIRDLTGVKTSTPMFWNIMRLSESQGYWKHVNLINVGRFLSLICAFPWYVALCYTLDRIVDFDYLGWNGWSLFFMKSCLFFLPWIIYLSYRHARYKTWRREVDIFNDALLKQLGFTTQFETWRATPSRQSGDRADAILDYLKSPDCMSLLLWRENPTK